MRLMSLFLLVFVGCVQTVYVRPIDFPAPSLTKYIPQEAQVYETLFYGHANLGYSALPAVRKSYKTHQGLYLTNFYLGGMLSSASFDEIQGDRIWRIEARITEGSEGFFLFTFYVWDQNTSTAIPHDVRWMSPEQLMTFSLELKKNCMDTPSQHRLREVANEDF